MDTEWNAEWNVERNSYRVEYSVECRVILRLQCYPRFGISRWKIGLVAAPSVNYTATVPPLQSGNVDSQCNVVSQMFTPPKATLVMCAAALLQEI